MFFILFAVLLVSQTNAIGIDRINQVVTVTDDVKAPGQLMPAGYNECSANFVIGSNCGAGNYVQCGPDMLGIFSESWLIPGPPGSTASTYMLCEWFGSVGGGQCVPKAMGNSSDYCFVATYGTPTTSPTISTTSTRTVTTTPTPTYTPHPSTSITPTITPTSTPTFTPHPSTSITPTITPTSTPSYTSHPSTSISPTTSVTRSFTSSLSVTSSKTPTVSDTPSKTPAASTSASKTPTRSISKSAAGSPSVTSSTSRSSTNTASISISASAAPSASNTEWAEKCYALYNEANSYNIGPMKMRDIESVTLTVGDAYRIDLSHYFCDPERDDLTYSVEGYVPDGLSLDGSVLSGTVTTAGHYILQAWAIDGAHHPPSPANHFSITVQARI